MSTSTRRRARPRLSPRATLLIALCAVAGFCPLQAQTIVGRVLDDARESPVSGAAVRLLDKDGNKKAEALADEVGRFVIVPPKDGEYYLEATRIGYHRAITPLLAFAGQDERVQLDLMMSPAPIGLEGFSVEVDVETRASEDLKLSGVRPRDLGNRWVSRADIEAVAIRPDVGNVLEYRSIAGIRIIRPENLVPGSADLGLCVSLTRARTGSGAGTCALVVLDGLPITGAQALFVDPEWVEAMAVLLPTEATTLYGTQGGGGALVIWTRLRGGR